MNVENEFYESLNNVINDEDNEEFVVFQRKIYDSLSDYWNKTSDLGLLTTILGPRLKKLSLFDSDTKQNIIEKLKEIYLQYEENETLVNENSSNLSETSRYSSNFFETIFDNEVQENMIRCLKWTNIWIFV